MGEHMFPVNPTTEKYYSRHDFWRLFWHRKLRSALLGGSRLALVCGKPAWREEYLGDQFYTIKASGSQDSWSKERLWARLWQCSELFRNLICCCVDNLDNLDKLYGSSFNSKKPWEEKRSTWPVIVQSNPEVQVPGFDPTSFAKFWFPWLSIISPIDLWKQ